MSRKHRASLSPGSCAHSLLFLATVQTLYGSRPWVLDAILIILEMCQCPFLCKYLGEDILMLHSLIYISQRLKEKKGGGFKVSVLSLLIFQTELSLSHEYYGKSHMFLITFKYLFFLRVYLLCLHLCKCTTCTLYIAHCLLRSEKGIESPDTCEQYMGAEK